MTKKTLSLLPLGLLLSSSLALAQAAPATPAAAPPPAAPAAEPAPAAPAAEPAPAAPEAAPMAPAPEMVPAAPAPEPEAAPAPAAPSPPPAITGYVESAYHLDVTKPRSASVPLRSYDGRGGNTFLLHGAHIAINHAFSQDVSATVEIDAGSDAAITGGAGGAYAFDVQEAYAKYSHNGFTLTAGKFVTYEGIEVIEGPNNPTLTRGYLFGLAEPFTHVGAKAHYSPDGKWDFGLGLVNGWDQWIDTNDWKTIIARIGYADPSFFLGLSGSFGSEQAGPNSNDRLSLDLTGGSIMGDTTLNFQGNFGTEKFGPGLSDTWFGLGIQPLYKKDAFSFGGRLEWFYDKHGSRIAVPPATMGVLNPVEKGNVVNVALTPGYTLADHFVIRFEPRIDLALGGDVAGNKKYLDGKKLVFSLGLGAHYIF